MKDIKWAAIQPLTGGMYFGAEKCIGHPAEFILSYKGLNEPKYDKEGTMIDAANEYHLTQYLKKVGRMPKYYVFNDRVMFQNDHDMEPWITEEGSDAAFKLEPGKVGLDLVVAVPVCSGLSSATIGKQDTKDARNCNMKWIMEYTLNVIQPKVYIFENAPRLSSNAGASVRESLNKIAADAGYSVVYYKTDTMLHDNCQHRPRTFVIAIKGEGTPDMLWENKNVSIAEFLGRIPKDAPTNYPVKMWEGNRIMWDYLIHHFGETEWRDHMYIDIVATIVKNNLYDDFLKFVEKYDCEQIWKDRLLKFVNHVQNKLAQGLGYYADCPLICKSYTPSVQFKTIPNIIHPTENRVLTLRECLSLMGMPYDFEMHGDPERYQCRIGQNVPARTAFWVVSEAVRIINDWDTIERNNESVMLFDNIKQVKKAV